jgi:hypothetical protein
MRLPAAIVTAVLVWSAARYLPPYFLELRKMDLEEEKVALQSTKANQILREMRLQMRPAVEPSKAKPARQQNDSSFYY